MNYKKLAEEYFLTLHGLSPHHSHRQMNESLHGEMFALHYLDTTGKDVLPSELTKKMHVSSARTAATLKSLEEKGWITRRLDDRDKRKVLVSLTEEGKEEAKKNHEHMIEKISQMLEALGEEDARHLVRIMGRLKEMCPRTKKEQE